MQLVSGYARKIIALFFNSLDTKNVFFAEINHLKKTKNHPPTTMTKTIIALALVAGLTSFAESVKADTFGTGGNP